MQDYIELNRNQLDFDLEMLPIFDNTKEISFFKDIIGQERAVEAINLGLSINKKGYNIYVSGESGTGKRSYVIKRTMEYASELNAPLDWCYVYNFTDCYSPIAISFKSGTAIEFKEDINNVINFMFDEVPKYFASENYEREKNSLIERYQGEIVKLGDRLYNEAKKRGFNVKSSKDGFAFVPLINEKEMSESEYNELAETERMEITTNVNSLKIIAYDVLKQIKLIKKYMADEIKELEYQISNELVNKKIDFLKNKYSYNKKAILYLENVKADIIENIDAFMDDEDEKYDDVFFKRYFINAIVNNKEINGAPVVYENSPEFCNLIGNVEYENKSGSLITDFTMIKGGSLHRANGGYLIIDVMQLLNSYRSWEALKKSLKSEAICIESIKNQFDIIQIATLKPEDIPLDVKVILTGNPYIYHILYNYDEDFRELFKIRADFDDQIKNNNGTVIKLLGFLSYYCYQNNISPISRDGVVELFKYSFRIAQSKKYFTASMDKLAELIDEAAAIAIKEKSKIITKEKVLSAISQKERRHGLYKDKILDMYREGKYIVDIKGYKIGQINGLSILDFKDVSFGKLNRITATTFAGRDGIINIERETNMSGDIHSKGVMILSGYIGELFGQNMPLSFSASICFEQLYGEVDGDSASAAELIALMSSLGDIPIKQSIAITGSINQRGEIQPIGGVNEKIEGYFDICNIYGLDGSHGVIIPFSNVDELILKDEVLNAIEEGLYHIYAVKKIDDCFEILCNTIKNNRKLKNIDIFKERIIKKFEKYRNAFFEKNRR